MHLLTKELLRTIPPLYSQENEADPLCQVRLFMPDGAFAWFVALRADRDPGHAQAAGGTGPILHPDAAV